MMAATSHFVLLSHSTIFSRSSLESSCSTSILSFGPLDKGICRSLRPSNVSRNSCKYYRVYTDGGDNHDARVGNPVNKFSSFRAAVHLLDAYRKRIPIESNSVNKGLSVCHFYTRSPARTSSSILRTVKRRATLGGDGGVDIRGDVIAEDYYSVLGLTPDATPDEIKKAYYSCMKTCHPDLSGNSPAVNDFCMFINEVYEVLSDPEQRIIYDEINGYTLTATNPFRDTSAARDHTFVDEFTCIGCKNCANTAPATFEIEENYGRARVTCQVGNPVLVQTAIQTCPVDCIHWVTPAQLTLLEDEMRVVERVNVGMMLSGMGFRSPDVFTQASWKWDKRQAKAVERARIRMMKETGSSSWWDVHWGSGADDNKSKSSADKYSRERAAKTAAAARRWREYSRQGVDGRAIRNLPSGSLFDEEVEKEKAAAK